MTHVLRGLNVVIFSVLKCAWSKHLQEWMESHSGQIGKENFLKIYGAAHMEEAFTPQNILASFTATGTEPFNQDVIPMSKMQPSMEFSTQGTFPMTRLTPVNHIEA